MKPAESSTDETNDEVPKDSQESCGSRTPDTLILSDNENGNDSERKMNLSAHDFIPNCSIFVSRFQGLTLPESDTKGMVAKCNINQCPINTYHLSCLKLQRVPNGWFCPLCHKTAKENQLKGQNETIEKALKVDSVCLCQKKALQTDRLLECHNESCASGRFFHLQCLNYKRMPNNAKATWICPTCALNNVKTKGVKNKTTSEAKSSKKKLNLSQAKCNIIKNPIGWLTGDIIQEIHETLTKIDPPNGRLAGPSTGTNQSVQKNNWTVYSNIVYWQ
ncbi:hypothetical protein AC249_AIPGENE21827 [Exaiptasia diaphana]|nr:hypothetical protein AC249_AIPGENE21827 [Exaiptasia diaphana]